jgi:hypothetical protein
MRHWIHLSNAQAYYGAWQKDVLLVERFDRQKHTVGWTRNALVSALTLFGLDEQMTRYASYETLAEIVRHRFVDPRQRSRSFSPVWCSIFFAAIQTITPATTPLSGTERCCP